MRVMARIIIIGGGVMGSSAAYHLAMAGAAADDNDPCHSAHIIAGAALRLSQFAMLSVRYPVQACLLRLWVG
jgi:glycine/D-amino acid oxidase-like deaminating enzyme